MRSNRRLTAISAIRRTGCATVVIGGSTSSAHLSTFEADFFRTWIRQGDAEKIPLFAYVYHEHGPVRLDG